MDHTSKTNRPLPKKQTTSTQHLIYANEVKAAQRHVQNQLDKRKNIHDDEELMAFTLFYAATESGIAFEQGLVAFRDGLLSNSIPKHLTVKDGKVVVQLHYNRRGHAIPVGSATALPTRRISLGPYTFSLCTNLLKRVKKKRFGAYKVDLWQLIATHCFDKLGQRCTIKTLSQFCQGASQWAYDQAKPGTPAFIKNYIAGSIASTPMMLEHELQIQHVFSRPLAPLNKSISNLVSNAHYKAPERNLGAPQTSKANVQINTHLKRAFSETDERGRIRTAKDIAISLDGIAHDFQGIAQLPRMLILFYQWCLQKKVNPSLPYWTATATFRRSKGAIFRAIYNASTDISGTDILELDEDEMHELCGIIKVHREQLGEIKDNFYTELHAFFQYLVEVHGVTYPADFFDEKLGKKPSRVRSYLYNEDVYQQLIIDTRNQLERQKTPARIMHSIDIALLLARRLFLRPGELWSIKFKDIQLGSAITLMIRQNEWGKLKTTSSRRNLPLWLLLCPNEQQRVIDFLNHRQLELAANGRNDGLLFSQSDIEDSIFKSGEMSSFFGQLLSFRLGFQAVFYQFRHTGISELVYIMFGSEQHIEDRTGYKIDFAKRVKSQLQRGNAVNHLDEIARLAGHHTPYTTSRSYTHILDDIAYACLCENRTINTRVAGALSGIKKSRTCDVMQPEEMTMPELIAYFGKALNHIANVIPTKRVSKRIIAPPLNVETNTLTNCLNVLKYFDIYQSLEACTTQLNIRPEYTKTWVKSAKAAKELFSTKYGNSRLFEPGSKAIAPGDRNRAQDIALRDKLCLFFEQYVAKHDERFFWLATTMLSCISYDNSPYKLKDPLVVKKVIGILAPVIPQSQWELNLTVTKANRKEVVAAWKPYLPQKTIKLNLVEELNDPNPKLRLINNKAAQNKTGTENSPALKFALHLCLIFYWGRLKKYVV